MATLDAGVAVHNRVTTVDLTGADAPAVLATLTQTARERAARAAGLVSSTWLSHRPGDDGAARLVHYEHWASGEDGDGGAEALLGLEEVAPLLRSGVVHGYHVHDVVCASERAPLVLLPSVMPPRT